MCRTRFRYAVETYHLSALMHGDTQSNVCVCVCIHVAKYIAFRKRTVKRGSFSCHAFLTRAYMPMTHRLYMLLSIIRKSLSFHFFFVQAPGVVYSIHTCIIRRCTNELQLLVLFIMKTRGVILLFRSIFLRLSGDTNQSREFCLTAAPTLFLHDRDHFVLLMLHNK